jgi:hypothetical protein
MFARLLRIASLVSVACSMLLTLSAEDFTTLTAGMPISRREDPLPQDFGGAGMGGYNDLTPIFILNLSDGSQAPRFPHPEQR